MKEIPEVSLIIPVYNCEHTLAQSLETVSRQKFDSFEVILVDDGSTDGSPSICDQIAASDSRFRVIHQSNQGASAARNTGIDASQARWIVFMDADDEISENYLSTLYNHRVENGLAICGFYEQQGNNEIKLSIDFGNHEFSVKESNLNQILENKDLLEHPSPIARIFDNNIIRKHHIYFDSTISLCEDLIFFLEYSLNATRITLLAPVGYLYLKDNSILTKRIPPFESELSLGENFERLCENLSIKYGKCKNNQYINHFTAARYMSAALNLYSYRQSRTERLKKLRYLISKHKNNIDKFYFAPTIMLATFKHLLLTSPCIFDRFMQLRSWIKR